MLETFRSMIQQQRDDLENQTTFVEDGIAVAAVTTDFEALKDKLDALLATIDAQ